MSLDFYVSQIEAEKEIHSWVQLFALAYLEKKEGKTKLAEFIANRAYNAIDDATPTGWGIKKALKTLVRNEKTRVEPLNKVKKKDCDPGCDKDGFP